jgi:single-strand DNA-binding protein
LINKVLLIGRLTRDPQLKYTPNQVAVCSFTLAVDRSHTNQQGEREADFIPIVVWRNLAETCDKYLKKGRLTAVSGRLQTRNYETPEGQRRYITEVIADEIQFLERPSNTGAPAPDEAPPAGGFTPLDPGEEDDELPF